MASLARNYLGLYFNTRQIRNKWDCRKSSALSEKKGHLRCCCSQVWTMNGGRIPWNATAICEVFRIFLSDEKTSYERRFGMPFNGLVIPFGETVEYHPILAKDMARVHQFGPKVLQVFFLGCVLYAGESGKETSWSQTLKKWKRWTHQNSTSQGSMLRKC